MANADHSTLPVDFVSVGLSSLRAHREFGALPPSHRRGYLFQVDRALHPMLERIVRTIGRLTKAGD
jgi:hypothetical protein